MKKEANAAPQDGGNENKFAQWYKGKSRKRMSKPSGFIVDVLDRLAADAEFNYTAYPPSGKGKHCTKCLKSSPKSNDSSYKCRSSYACAEDDLFDESLDETNKRDLFAGLIYVTAEREQRGVRFTAPILSGSGISLVRVVPVHTWHDNFSVRFFFFRVSVVSLKSSFCYFYSVLRKEEKSKRHRRAASLSAIHARHVAL